MRLRSSQGGFTFPELLTAIGIGSVVLAALAVGSLALQRGFAAADHQIGCQEDQMRVLDYVTRDLRRATEFVISNQNTKLTLSVPGRPLLGAGGGLPLPTVSDGVVRYGVAPVTVEYCKEGINLIRRENGTAVTLSTRIEEFRAYPVAPELVNLHLTFVPKFSRTPNAAATAATLVQVLAAARNTKGNIQ